MNTEPERTLLEKDIDTLYQQVRKGEKRGKRASVGREFIAYVLKIVAGGGSLVVATGRFPEWHQLIGIAILVAIFLDTISANYKRLLAEVKAGYAYEFLREKVSRTYNRKLDPLLRQRNRPETADAAQNAIDALQQATHAELTDGIAQIRASLAEANLKGLEALALDNERAAVQQGAGSAT